ncbi:plant expansin [Coniophora puteana RWD-64-598 SS2]|uniref:Plant expansin n=1 Tax=Coniophora puteana (strain RWD-64-598) TaxID=741705 RepID=A0A5M3MN65_CONPW|nr:plant expansin [Coniophora puteana RWD-64-598 SS2]EIW80214.1 plant expansin [Coniophora puteana RWD-64-598 SS2]
MFCAALVLAASLAVVSVHAAETDPQTGDVFFFAPGLGACGYTNTSDQAVASVSQNFFNNYPNATANPNDNPICAHNLTVTVGNTSVSAQIVDYFLSGFSDTSIGLSQSAFQTVANTSNGVVSNVTWVVDPLPTNSSSS